jgi:hypothetical protein
MDWEHKLSSLGAAALVLPFSEFVLFAKHGGTLAPMISFVEDPHDAMGSIAKIVASLPALLRLVRALQPPWQQSSDSLRAESIQSK